MAIVKLLLDTGIVNPLPVMEQLPDIEREMVGSMGHNSSRLQRRLLYPFHLKAVKKELRISANRDIPTSPMVSRL